MADVSPKPTGITLLPRIRAPLFVFGLAVLSRGLLLYYRLVILGTPLIRLGGSDVNGWLGMASHLYHNRDLSYWLMGARPPMFPLTVALIYTLGGGNLHAAILQVLFGALTPVLGYVMAHRLLAPIKGIPLAKRMALLAGVVMALDPASVSATTALMSEPLFNLLLTACLLALVLFVQGGRWQHLVLTALCMGLAMLTRLTTIFFWMAALLILIPLVRKWWQPAVVLAAVGLTIYLGWSARNLRYHGVFTYSMQSNFSLLFLRSLSAEHIATGATVDALYARYIGELYHNTGLPEPASQTLPEKFWGLLVADDPALYTEMGRMARQKLMQYWPYALLGTGTGIWRLFALTDDLPPWLAPVELVYHALLYGLAIWGAWQSFKHREWPLLLLTGVPILYVTTLTLVAQVSAMDTRMRTPISVPIILLAVYGLKEALLSLRSLHMRQPRASA